MIKFDNVSKVYPNGFKGLKNICLEIKQGEFVAIIGLSGAGKSTLIRTINRVHDVTEGTLTVDDVDVNSLKGKSLRKFRREIGMIFQSFNLISRFCFEGNVRYAAILGYVGAGGLGLILNEKIGWREYSSVGMILISLFVTVMVIEVISHYLRKKLT